DENSVRSAGLESAGQSQDRARVDNANVNAGGGAVPVSGEASSPRRMPSTSARSGELEVDASEAVDGVVDGDDVGGGGSGNTSPPGGRTGESGTSATLTEKAAAAVAAATVNAAVAVAVSAASAPAAAAAARTSRARRGEE
ncbi:unnamed protein product, partial [Laminaria digitata]